MKKILFVTLLLLSLPAFPHEGEDHGPTAPSAPASAAEPRLEATSPDFELLAVLKDGALILYLDRYASNEPVSGAKIELESGQHKSQAKAAGDGVYTLPAPWLAPPGHYEMNFTVEAGDTVDLLAGVFAVGDGSHEGGQAKWKTVAAWVAAAIALLALAGFLRRGRRRSPPLLWLVLGLALAAPERPALAHEGEDHGPALLPASAGSPARLPDGSVFVPKQAQRLLGLRTVLAEAGEVAKSVELNGHIVPDPNASGRIQAAQAGRVEAPDAGLPHLGKTVKKGEVLAWLVPVSTSLERGSQQAQLAELEAQALIAGHRAERLKQLEGSVPRKEIDAARTESAALQKRRAAVAASLYQREALRSPADGIVSAITASVGQVVEARAVLFEVVDPGRLWVEALGYDAPQASGIRSARAVTGDGQSLDLQFLGVGYQLREHALPLQFRIQPKDPMAAVSVGQPVRVYAAGGETVKGIPLPQGAVVKGPSNDTLVWVHAAAERFASKPVQVRPLDGSRVTVTAGLKPGERVVVQGAPLLSQVR